MMKQKKAMLTWKNLTTVFSTGRQLSSLSMSSPLLHPETYTLNLTFKEFIGDKAEPEFWDSGYTQEELEAMSEAEFQEIMNQMPEEYSQNPNKYQNYWFKGDWSFEIPVTVDNSLTETLEINETNEEGIGLASIARTPYEITITPLYKEGSDSRLFPGCSGC